MTLPMRLQKFLAECGVASRRKAETLIADGRVQVNGAVATLGGSVDPGRDRVTVDGREIAHGEPRVYVILNKPPGVITSVTDTHGRRTVMDCVKGLDARVFPVGRLDRDVEGALLLTNDGDLAYRLTHPKYAIDKVYLVHVRGAVTENALAALREGVELDDGFAKPVEAELLRQDKHGSLLKLVLREGRKREVKRLCDHVGHKVRKLRRLSVGNVHCKGLSSGEWRRLNERELSALRALAGLDP